jgi:hypothetical protein
MDFNLEKCKFGDFDKKQVEQIFYKLQFNSLINKL